MDLAHLQDVIDRTYGERDRERGVPSTVAWLAEEVGELAQAVRKGSRAQREHEFADVLAWVASLANQVDVDLTRRGAALRRRVPAVLGDALHLPLRSRPYDGARRVVPGERRPRRRRVAMPEAQPAGWSVTGSPGLVRWGLRSWLLVGVLAFAAAVLWLLSQVSGFVVPFIIALVLGALFAPLVERLQARGVPRSGGALLVLLALTAVVVGSTWLVVAGVVGQAPQIRTEITAGPRHPQQLAGEPRHRRRQRCVVERPGRVRLRARRSAGSCPRSAAPSRVPSRSVSAPRSAPSSSTTCSSTGRA